MNAFMFSGSGTACSTGQSNRAEQPIPGMDLLIPRVDREVVDGAADVQHSAPQRVIPGRPIGLRHDDRPLT